MLFNEPKLLKFRLNLTPEFTSPGFSALQRAEIAEMYLYKSSLLYSVCFSALQRAEIAEIIITYCNKRFVCIRFSALQRAEIAEIELLHLWEPSVRSGFSALQRAEIAEIYRLDFVLPRALSFSALQRAEIAEIASPSCGAGCGCSFQCSSTSRNC